MLDLLRRAAYFRQNLVVVNRSRRALLGVRREGGRGVMLKPALKSTNTLTSFGRFSSKRPPLLHRDVDQVVRRQWYSQHQIENNPPSLRISPSS
ncbi:hypothetical protein D9758_014426 [Tetrapyrgos nigripes]|uniref:Uncharacterized protein n=1 Tax=Tetrapyrgos nigripes TaxID=182062 RepID=A0A8H5CN33_9AGAR|nr:hypothetical protein D9758_014426 [Tetrapyrgos nigripes]